MARKYVIHEKEVVKKMAPLRDNPPTSPVEFIIGVDDNGHEITQTCALADVFFPTLGMSNHPLFIDFNKKVLDKYRQAAEGYLLWEMCVASPIHNWSIPIDSYHDDKVTVLLGYLSELPYAEQLHWRAHNIPPNGGVSEAYYQLYIKSFPFRDAQHPQTWFRDAYYQLQAKCYEYLGWQLLLPPQPDAEHYIADLTLPAPDEHRDFDALVTSLCKLCIDSLNLSKLKKLTAERTSEGKRAFVTQRKHGLSKRYQRTLAEKDTLACFLEILSSREAALRDYCYFMLEIQRLRCTSTAYRKSSNYRQIADDFGVDNRSLQAVFAGILTQASSLVTHFCSLVTGGILNELIHRPARAVNR